jgi:translation initiation factor 1
VGNKDRKKSDLGEGSNKLSHNPFASLQGRVALPSRALESETLGEPAQQASQADTNVPATSKKRSLGRLVQRRETKHRGGKAVIVVSGFGALSGYPRAAVEALAKTVKAKLGCGGTVEDGPTGLEIVIQGDQAKKVAELLRQEGFRVDGVTT